jgi:3-oxoacyl-[acyl-carrier-protein] synthase II
MTAEFRVAVTGVGLTTPLGRDLPELMAHLRAGASSVRRMPEWEASFCRTKVASVVDGFDEKSVPRHLRRSMSRVSLLAYDATVKAIQDARLSEELVQSPRTGVSYGSTMGGTKAIERSFSALSGNALPQDFYSSTFLQIMSHTCASNLVVALKIPGRVIASCVACAASTQAIGFGFEAIRYGKLDRVLCGGAEEMHLSVPSVFDSLYATSTQYNDRPQQTPRPFSADRDGLVVGEGAGTLVLEEWEQAHARGAHIYAEIIGFHTNADGNHMTNPSQAGMEQVMRGALADAGVAPDQVSYVNAHATATEVGDIAESAAVYALFRDGVPVSSLKGHFGHLMGACGVVESAACLGMMSENWASPTLHLDAVDPRCAPLYYVKNVGVDRPLGVVLKNSFAFGGINASLVFRKV